MLKLISLEIKKYNLRQFVRSAIIATLVITAIIIFAPYAEKLEGDIAFPDLNTAFYVIDLMVRGTFIIFSGVLVGKIIIGEFKNKTIMLLFMYPIKRKKFIAAKLAVIAAFIIAACVLSDVFITVSLAVFNHYYHVMPGELTGALVAQRILRIGTNALLTAGIGLIPLYFGMRKKSVSTTIVSSVILTSLLSSGNEGHSLSSIVIIPIILSIIGVGVAYFSIRNIEYIDVV